MRMVTARSSSMRSAWTLSAMGLLAAGLAVGCAEAAPGAPPPKADTPDEGGATPELGKVDSTPSPTSGLGVLRFLPVTSYSGWDGVHTFKAPVAVYDHGDDLTVSAVDPSAVDVAPATLRSGAEKDAGKYFLLTPKKPGVHTIVATSKGKKAEIAINVTRYEPAQWTTGEQRYQTAGTTGDPPCMQCHENGEAIDHSPAALSTANDKTVGTVITTGRSTHGFPIKIDGKLGHRWTVTDTERQALVVYLRGLPPVGFQ